MWDGKDRRKADISLKEQLDMIAFDLQKVSIQLDNYHSNSKTYREAMAEEMTKIKLTLYGNGQPGLTTKINKINSLDEDLKNHIKVDIGFFTVVITILLTILGWTIFKK